MAAMKNNDKDKMLTADEVAAKLHFNPYTVRDMLRNGDIKGYKIRSKWRVKKADLDDYLAKHREDY